MGLHGYGVDDVLTQHAFIECREGMLEHLVHIRPRDLSALTSPCNMRWCDADLDPGHCVTPTSIAAILQPAVPM